jgi:hypothetical protein
MPLSQKLSLVAEQYTVSLSSGTMANSYTEALSTFFAQLSTGNVFLTVRNSDAGEIEELDDIGEEPTFDVAELGIQMLCTAAHSMSAHERTELLAKLQERMAPHQA